MVPGFLEENVVMAGELTNVRKNQMTPQQGRKGQGGPSQSQQTSGAVLKGPKFFLAPLQSPDPVKCSTRALLARFVGWQSRRPRPEDKEVGRPAKRGHGPGVVGPGSAAERDFHLAASLPAVP